MSKFTFLVLAIAVGHNLGFGLSTPEVDEQSKDNSTTDEIDIGYNIIDGMNSSSQQFERIHGGQNAKPGQFPYLARLKFPTKPLHCGGIIISEWHILTAAHCTITHKARYLKVVLGDYSISSRDGEVFFKIDKIFNHENYLTDSGNDISLIKLKWPIRFRTNSEGFGSINSIRLPQNSSIIYETNSSVTVSGWGIEESNSTENSDIVKFVKLSIVDQASCVEAYKNISILVVDEEICAGVPGGGKDSCRGDSGGPLVRQIGDNNFELVGIVSHGDGGCGNANFPGVYTRVASHLNWINSRLAL